VKFVTGSQPGKSPSAPALREGDGLSDDDGETLGLTLGETEGDSLLAGTRTGPVTG
jgi:hypothetical protein